MRPQILPANSGDLITVMGVRHRVVATGEQTGGAYTILKLSIPLGKGVPAHVHTREDELFHILEGAAEIVVGGERTEVRAGVTVLGPRGTPHGYKGTSKEPCRMLVVVTPGGFERFLGELRGAKDPETIGAIAGRHGITFA